MRLINIIIFHSHVFHVNASFGFIWVWNLVSDITGSAYIEGVGELDIGVNIWPQQGRSVKGVEKTELRGAK
jgi:hypothetical protein